LDGVFLIVVLPSFGNGFGNYLRVNSVSNMAIYKTPPAGPDDNKKHMLKPDTRN